VRIVGGKWAGKDLVSPGGRVRPTAEEVRVRWMELLDGELEDADVVDLYAGTGALGIEALSRGAARADFVENNPSALHALKANVALIRAKDRTRIFKRDALRWAEALGAGSYDLAFADPPYGSKQGDRLVQAWRATGFARILVVEHAADHALPQGGRTHRLGDSALTIYRAR
jgi:16S rRNA (guanine966-N2)-methyltransferase